MSVPLLLCALLVRVNAAADQVLHGPAPCTQHLLERCDANGSCHPDNDHCPPVTTEPSCGEHPHSGRDGAVLTWGLAYRADSAQACCDKCREHHRGCNSCLTAGPRTLIHLLASPD